MSHDPENDAQQAERLRMAGLYRAIFEDDKRGQAVLADLIRKFARAPARGFGPDAVMETFVNAHTRRVFDHINLMINAADGIDEPPTDERHDDDLP